MNLKLTKPLVFFDLETTGINIAKDRIVEISIIKIHPDGKEDRYTQRVNPVIEIPFEASQVHGITNEMVLNEPTFKEIAPKIKEMIKGCDLAGFNSNRFDIPLLAEEMLRAETDFSMKNRHAIDIQTIYHKKEQRTLSAAYKFYCDKDLTDAHSAEADTFATFEVLKAQLEKYEDLENDVKSLSEFSSHRDRADFAGFILFDDKGEEIFSFGKYKGKRVTEIFAQDPGYYAWIQQADFPLYTKKVLTEIKLRGFNKK